MTKGFTHNEFMVIPYNHWKYDTQWLVEIRDKKLVTIFITLVTALDPDGAAECAIEEFVEINKKS
jgi:hypothetical protein